MTRATPNQPKEVAHFVPEVPPTAHANPVNDVLSFPPHMSMYSMITEELLIAISSWTSVGTT
jgi:hypothetical protein